jgi:hypothetical protein
MTDSHSSRTRRSVISPSPAGPLAKGHSKDQAGRRLEARNRAILAAQAVLDGKAAAITEKATQLALSGEINAIRLCLRLSVPPRREQPIEFEIRQLTWIHDAGEAIADVIAAVAAARITLAEAAEMVRLIEAYVRTCTAAQQSAQAESRAEQYRHWWPRGSETFSLRTRKR